MGGLRSFALRTSSRPPLRANTGDRVRVVGDCFGFPVLFGGFWVVETSQPSNNMSILQALEAISEPSEPYFTTIILVWECLPKWLGRGALSSIVWSEDFFKTTVSIADLEVSGVLYALSCLSGHAAVASRDAFYEAFVSDMTFQSKLECHDRRVMLSSSYLPDTSRLHFRDFTDDKKSVESCWRVIRPFIYCLCKE